MPSIESVFVRFSGVSYPPPALPISTIDTTIHESPRVAIMVRFLDIFYLYRRRARIYSFSFYTLRIGISFGSLVVPALLSLNKSEQLFWIIWMVSLLVSISNSLISIFKIDKKYYSLNAIYRKLESEGWQFMNLTGNYYTAPEIGHDSQIQNFAFRLEKITMEQADEEYRNIQDKTDKSLSSQDTYVPNSRVQKQKTSEQHNSLPHSSDGQRNTQTVPQQNKKTTTQPQTTVVEVT